MKATSGSLRIDQRYSLIDTEYLGGFDTFDYSTCDNCGLAIANVAIVEGEQDKAKYRIGIDCAATLTTINPCEIAEAKKKLARKARFIKRIKTECTFAIVGEHMVWFYKKPQEKWQSFWLGRSYLEEGLKLIKSMNMPYIVDTK